MRFNKVTKNALWIIGCRIVQSVLALAINILQVRAFGPSDFGLISYAASVVAFFAPLMKLGIDCILVNELVRYPEKEGETMGSALFLTFVSSILCVSGVVGFAFVANPGETETVWICALYSTLLVAQSLEMTQYWFQAKYLSKYMSMTVLVAFLVISAYRLILLMTGKSVYWFAVSQAFDYTLIAIALMIFYRVKGGSRLRVSGEAIKRLLGQSKHYILPQLLVTGYAQIDKIMLKGMGDEETVGYYAAAVSVCHFTNFVFNAISDSMRPSIIEQKNKSQEGFQQQLTQLYRITIYLALLQAVAVTVFSELILKILYEEQFLAAAGALRIVIWGTLLSYIGSVRSIWMLTESKQKYLLLINVCGIAINVLLNMLLISRWGMIGAAITSLTTQFVTNVGIGLILKPLRENNRYILQSLDPRPLFKLFSRKR